MPTAVQTAVTPTASTLAHCIGEATGYQVRDLEVDVQGKRVFVSGRSRSFYVKQLVTRAVQNLLPTARLANDVRVCSPA